MLRTNIALAGFLLSYVLASATVTPQQELSRIADAVSDGTIQEVDVLAIPKETMFRSNVTTETLAKNFQCKVVLREMQRSGKSLSRALHNTEASSFSRSVDVRRGVLFLDKNGHVLFSVYLDAFGQGEINGQQARLSGEFVQWIEDRLPQEYW